MYTFLKRNLAFSTLFFALMIMVSSCNSNNTSQRNDLLTYLPDNAILTGTINPAAILKSAGATVNKGEIELPPFLNKVAASNEVFAMLVSAKGVDYENIAFILSDKDIRFICNLNNPDKFANWLIGQGLENSSEGNYNVYINQKQNLAVAIQDRIAWIIPNVDEPATVQKNVDIFNKEATENKLADWKAELLSKNDASFIIDIYGLNDLMAKNMGELGIPATYNSMSSLYADNCSFFHFGLNLDGPSLRFAGSTFDSSGNPTPMLAKGTYETIPSEVIALIKDYQVSFGFSCFDNWKDMISTLYGTALAADTDTAYMNAIQSSLDVIKSISFGVSLDKNGNILNFNPKQINAVAAIAFDREQMNNCIDKWSDVVKDIPQSYVNEFTTAYNACKSSDGYSFAPVSQFPDFKIKFRQKDNLLIGLTNSVSKDIDLKENPDFSNLIGFVSVDLPKSHQLMQLAGCPFGIKIYGTSTADATEGEFTLTDCNNNFIEAIIYYISRL